MKTIAALTFLAFAVGATAEPLRLSHPLEHQGTCDGSAGVTVGTNLVLVASDEDNVLRMYSSSRNSLPITSFNLDSFLGSGRFAAESDLEGAAQVDSRIYWISSHNRDMKARGMVNRAHFFATDIKKSGDQVSVTPVGVPYHGLLKDLVSDPQYARYKLAKAALREPKSDDALDIEGLAATPEGHLLIGFRNPVPHDRALMAPLLNPNDVIQGKKAQFGKAVELDLDGLGIRDMVHIGNKYLILAGRHDSRQKCRLYEWAGPGAKPKRISVHGLEDLNAEAIIWNPASTRVQILTDDGGRSIAGCDCKDLKDSSKQFFRSFVLEGYPL